MSNDRLLEQNEELKRRLKRAEIALLNAEAISGTLEHQNKAFDEIREVIDRLAGRLTNLENEVSNQKQMIVKSLQMRYGNGPTA